MINVQEVKQKIISILEQRGPSLPIHISREIKLTPVFATAILAELTSEKRIKISRLKIGSSPLYLVPGDEEKLEQFADSNIEGTEKEAYLKLKLKKILIDNKQDPAIRVALRSIKDFAIPFKYQETLMWKYAFISNQEAEEIISKKLPKKQIIQQPHQLQQPQTSQPNTSKQIEPIFQQPKKQTLQKQSKPKKANQNFLEEIKTFLESKNIQLTSLQQFDKRKVIAIVNIKIQQHLLIAFNKKRITEKELITAYKKSAELGLPYYIITKAEPTKKMSEAINAYKNLLKIDKIE